MSEFEDATQAWRRELLLERALSSDCLDELEDHLRAAYAAHRRGGLPAAEAFAMARQQLGDSTALAAEFRKVEGRGWRQIVIAGWALFGIAFLLPVHEHGVTLAVTVGKVPGFEAFVVALRGLGGVIGILSALTNLVMLLTPLALWDRNRRWGPALAIATLIGVVLNGWWLLAEGGSGYLRIGYYVWWASFAVVGTGLAVRSRNALRKRILVEAS